MGSMRLKTAHLYEKGVGDEMEECLSLGFQDEFDSGDTIEFNTPLLAALSAAWDALEVAAAKALIERIRA
jgi:hypothetical protein